LKTQIQSAFFQNRQPSPEDMLKEAGLFMGLFSLFRKTVSDDQIRSYNAQGFVLVSRLIGKTLIEEARDQLTARIPAGQVGGLHQVLTDPALLRCVTKAVCESAAQLSGIKGRLKRPASVYTIAVCPQQGPWEWPSPHIDHARREDRFETLPPPFRIGCLIYLNDVTPHAGATVVWPESHRQLAQLAAGDPDRYKFLATLNADISKLPLNNPIELTAGAGDVLFYNSLCAHSGSKNLGPACRLALNHKW
jgi:hypothetical protein